MSSIKEAERDLKRSLQQSFGVDLHGVLTYGRRWDPHTHSESLRVVVDDVSTPEAIVNRLPRSIKGYPVKVSRAGPAEM